MKEKELDNTYMSEVGDGQKRLSTDPVEVNNGLDAIIVSNVTQTLSGGLTIALPNVAGANSLEVLIPAGTPIIHDIDQETGKDYFLPAFDWRALNTTKTGYYVGVASRAFVYGKNPVNVPIAKAAHINVDALCNELEKMFAKIGQQFERENFKKAYIGDSYGNWHNSLSLTFEQSLGEVVSYS